MKCLLLRSKNRRVMQNELCIKGKHKIFKYSHEPVKMKLQNNTIANY